MFTRFSLPNAMVGRPYQASIGVDSHTQAVCIIHCLIPPELGLSFDPATQTVSGVPVQAGEFHLEVSFHFATDLRTLPHLERYPCWLIVNPEPRSLWKTLPSDATAPYYRPDTEWGLQAAGAWRIAYASRRGRSHAHVGSFRDDAVWVQHDAASGWNVLAVADGAGSAAYSRQGAHLAVTVAGQTLAAALVGEAGTQLAVQVSAEAGTDAAKAALGQAYDLFGKAAWEALKAIEAEATASARPAKAYATTLLLLAHKPVALGHVIAAFGVGDGAMALYQAGGTLKLLQQIDSGEFAGQTRFLDRGVLGDAQAILSRIQVHYVPDFTALLLMSDGVSDAHFNSDVELHCQASWAQFWQALQPALPQDTLDTALLEWLDFWSPGNHDDRTLAVLWR